MTPEQIHESLDKMLANPKSKNFLNHLVRAYMPETNVTIVHNTPKDKINFKCVLTRVPMISSNEISELSNSPDYHDKVKNSTALSLIEKHLEALIAVTNNRATGVTGKDTTTFMSDKAYEIFLDWVVTKSMKGDKHINWLLGSIRRASFIKRAENIHDVDVQKKVDNIKNSGKQRVATFTLGDSSDALSKLKANLESNGN